MARNEWEALTGRSLLTVVLSHQPGFARCYWQRMRFRRHSARAATTDQYRLPPPRGFMAALVQGAVVALTQRDSKLIADLAPECRDLGKSRVVLSSCGAKSESG